MKIIVFGGDGYCGWPLSLGLSNAGHDVTIIDNLSSRTGNEEYSLSNRLLAWKTKTQKVINFKKVDIALNYQGLNDVIRKTEPECIFMLTDKISVLPVVNEENKLKSLDFKNNVFSCFQIMSSLFENKLTDCHVYYFVEPLYNLDITTDINFYMLYLFQKKIKAFNNLRFLSFCNVWGKDTDLTSFDQALTNRINKSNLIMTMLKNDGFEFDKEVKYSFTHIQDFVNKTLAEFQREEKEFKIKKLYTESLTYNQIFKIFQKESKGFYRDEKDIYLSPEALHELTELIRDTKDL